MAKPAGGTEQGTETSAINGLVADILERKVSILDVVRAAPNGDYWGFVQQSRLSHVLLSDVRVLKQLMAEVRSKLIEAGQDPDDGSIESELLRKDGHRRFPKLKEERTRAFKSQPSLLTGTTFEVRLEQYKALLEYVEKLWADACQLYIRGNFPIAAFMSILVVEEIGKLSGLAEELIYSDAPRTVAQTGAVVERSHRRKHFIGVVSGALINARLDRVLGKNIVKKILHEAESNELEKTRQSCLYIDTHDGRTVIPTERIDAERARVLAVLAGELMVEILGHFPWEFERMLENAIAFERATGMPEKLIGRH